MDNQFGIPVYYWPKKTRIFRTIMSLLKRIAQALSDDHDFPHALSGESLERRLEFLGANLAMAQLIVDGILEIVSKGYPGANIPKFVEQEVYFRMDSVFDLDAITSRMVGDDIRDLTAYQVLVRYVLQKVQEYQESRRTGQSEDFPHAPSRESLEKNLELRGANILKARDLAAETIDLSGQLRHNESLTQLCESSAYFGMESVFDLDKLPRASQEDVEDSVEHRLLTKYLIHSVEEHSRIPNDRADELYEERRDR